MNEELCKALHRSVDEKLERLEERMDHLTRPEDGTLAKMKASLEDTIGAAESKLNWLVIFLMTTVVGALVTIVLAKLGYK